LKILKALKKRLTLDFTYGPFPYLRLLQEPGGSGYISSKPLINYILQTKTNPTK